MKSRVTQGIRPVDAVLTAILCVLAVVLSL